MSEFDREPTECDECGVIETFDLLDSEMQGPDSNLQPTGRLLCVACYGPGWCPARGADLDIPYSIAPELKPHYDAWRSANPKD
jgi:hypothetical protein